MKTPKRPATFDPEDLSIRVRRGDSSAEERRALEHALSTSALLQSSHQVGRDFDEALRVRPGDDELIVRASVAAVSRVVLRRRSLAGRVLALAATLAFATSAAAAGYWFSEVRTGDAPSTTVETGRKADPRAEAARPARAEASAKTSPPDAEKPPMVQPEAEARPGPRGQASTQSAVATAASLFRDANSARRAGNFELASSLYTELQMKHPETDEASVSRVSLGKLLLASGRLREADRQFRAYLESGRKNLEEEALVGRAEALGRLGESGEERRVWEILLRSHPSSVYAVRARQRLDEHAATGASEHP